MKNAFTILGTLCVLVGIVWTLQGAGVIGGSFMSGQSLWLIIGIVTAVIGAVLLIIPRLRR